MARLSILFFISLCLFASITNAASDRSEEAGVYIVYMGGKGSSTPGTLRADQAQLMNSLSERNAMVQVFKHGFTGFAAHMSKDEANLITREPGVVSVFPDNSRTRSWSFLKLQHYLGNPIPATELHSSTANGADTIIGLIDSGVWPESKSFNDQGMGPIPKRWKGTCQETEDFPASSYNRYVSISVCTSVNTSVIHNSVTIGCMCNSKLAKSTKIIIMCIWMYIGYSMKCK